ncbi:MAG: type I-C CRISPR-associated protein Cas8c/Csd1 [bacterium]|nr:type I-C CRISPR-associated protein Cas8c/Csd1 [bacterium]
MTILQALSDHYDRLASRDEVPPYGYSNEKISFAILLSSEGRAVDVQPLLDVSGRKPRPSLRLVPQPVKRTSGIASNFLWDKTAYALGVKRDIELERPIPAEREHAAFKAFHATMLSESEDEGLRALMAFLDTWRPESYDELSHAEEMLGTNVVFQLDDGTLEFLHDRPVAQQIWANRPSQHDADGLCLVTGNRRPVARLHPTVKGVRGTQSSGASIVSFNLDAFESFAKRQGANAPVSERAAFAYTTALNTMLASGSRCRIQIGDATTVFWAETADPALADAVENLFSIMIVERPSDQSEAAEVRNKLEAIAEGRPLADTAPNVREDTRIHVLGLAPNAARLSIRFWHVDSIGVLADRIEEHWRDFQLEPPPWTLPPPVWQLLYETAAQRKAENIPPTLGGTLMRAILAGGRYPHALLAAVVARVRADKRINGGRAAICKAVLARDHRLNFEEEDAPVALHEDSGNVAYNLGRLFAAYAYAEKSLAERNATIRDKYAGTASATPFRVFPVLMRGYEHNRAGLAKAGGRKTGAGVRAEQAVRQIIELLPGDCDLPQSLRLEEQARFFIGYYHQEQAFYTKRDSEESREQPAELED